MRYSADIQGESRQVAVRADGPSAQVQVDETTYDVDFAPIRGSLFSLVTRGRSYAVDVVEEAEGVLAVWVAGERHRIEYQEEGRRRKKGAGPAGLARGGAKAVAAPMPGKVVKILVSVGQEVGAGQGVIVVEAMKMQNELKASGPGVVKAINVEEGTGVSGGDVLVVIE
jgi:biotin carboxyl carrier protein